MRRFLTSRLFRACVCLILVCCVLVLNSPIRVHALSGVISGITGGLGLTMGELAGLILAGAGVVVGSLTIQEYGDDLQRTLNQAMKAEQAKFYTDPAMQAQVLEEVNAWKAKAQAGYIELESGVAWIVNAVKDWAAGFLIGGAVSVPSPETILHGSTIPANTSVYLSPSTFVQCTVDTTVFRCLRYYYGEAVTSYFVSTSPFRYYWPSSALGWYDASATFSVNGTKYYYFGMNTYLPDGYTSGAVDIHSLGYSDKEFLTLSIGGTFEGIIEEDYVYPDAIIGGIADQISQGVTMDVIGLPDISVPGADVLPVNPSESQTEAAAITDYLLAGLLAGTITWEQYWELLGVYSPTLGTSLPTISIPNVDPALPPDNFELGDNGIGSNPVTSHPALPYALDLRDFFPFCIPFDLYKFFSLLCAEPEAPVFTWVVQDLGGNSYPITVDLSKWDNFAALTRKLQLFVFIIGLAMSSRKFIKW